VSLLAVPVVPVESSPALTRGLRLTGTASRRTHLGHRLAPCSVVGARKPSHDIPHYRIDISAAIICVRPARLYNLALRDLARVASNAAFESILTSAVQPEHRAELAVMSPRKLYC
jgi:hypothetical protein